LTGAAAHMAILGKINFSDWRVVIEQ
jgi:hypothetical protein